MPKKTGTSKRRQQRVSQTIQPSDLEAFVREADEVALLTHHTGWQILERDLNSYRAGISQRLPYLNPGKPEFYESCILAIAIDKIFSLVADYAENKKKAEELLIKLNNPEVAVAMDIDGE
jgi:hypothetical protein